MSSESARLVERTRDRRGVLTMVADGHGSGTGGRGPSAYNDARLSRTQPWRSRYPTPHGVKEHLARSSASDD